MWSWRSSQCQLPVREGVGPFSFWVSFWPIFWSIFKYPVILYPYIQIDNRVIIVFFSWRLDNVIQFNCIFYIYVFFFSWLCWTRRDDFIQFNCISIHISFHISIFSVDYVGHSVMILFSWIVFLFIFLLIFLFFSW